MKREHDRDMSVSRRDMAVAMPASVAYARAEQFYNALRLYFFGFWFTRNPVRERCEI